MLAALGTTDATAGTVAFSSTGSLPADQPFRPVNLGIVFTADANFSVDALGFYFQADLTGPETVGLYNSTATLLTSATVLLSDPMVSGYLFQSIAPVALTAGDQYTVDAFVGDNDWSYGLTLPNQTADVVFDYPDATYGSSLEFPTVRATASNGGPSGTYYGPNFEIAGASPVPEPASLGLFATALALTGCLRHRKKGVSVA
ncbi:MAG: DUF4082 domain-containing protein [Acetobacteraceae bacterium]